MGKNKHVDLFETIIPSVDLGYKDLWDADGVNDEGRKEIKADFWTLNRWISSPKSRDPKVLQHYLLTVNEYYNKNWNSIQKHPKLVWQTLCVCSIGDGKTHHREYIPLKKETNKKEKWLAEIFPNMKMSDVETLAAITTDKEIKEYARDLGWDKKQIADIKL